MNRVQMKIRIGTPLCISIILFPASLLFSLPRLNQIQFKSTHNSYWLDNRPSELIDNYNVWDIELDFGVNSSSGELIVGHDDPDPKFGLTTLSQWVSDALSASSINSHPLILKFEAKTKCSCGWLFDPCSTCWGWWEVADWGPWQTRLKNLLESYLGSRWLKQSEFRNRYNSSWPSVDSLKGRVIVDLLDNDSGRDLQDLGTDDFFIEAPFANNRDDLTSSGLVMTEPAGNPTDFGRYIRQHANRIRMDNGYKEPWSNVFVYPPQPSSVSPCCPTLPFGSTSQPYVSVGQASNAYYTSDNQPLSGVLIVNGGTYTEKVNISAPLSLTRSGATVSIGGNNVAYTVYLFVMDVSDAGTNNPVFISLTGAHGTTSEKTIAGSNEWLDRAAIQEAWIISQDIGDLSSISVRIGGNDDLYIERIEVRSATSGLYSSSTPVWVGTDHVNPTIFPLAH